MSAKGILKRKKNEENNYNYKSIKELPLPRSNSYDVAVGLYKPELVFGLATSSDNGFYTYDPSTGKASENAIIKIDGYPFMIKKI